MITPQIIDLNEADGYAITPFDLVKGALKKEKKYKKGLLYRGFNANNIPKLLKTGQDTDNEVVFCAAEERIIDPCPDDSTDVFSYACNHADPALAVFDPQFFCRCDEYAYKFKEPDKKLDALVAVYILKV